MCIRDSINTNCGSTHIEVLQKFVKENRLDVGFAYDGDADRCIAVDENGEVVDGEDVYKRQAVQRIGLPNQMKGHTAQNGQLDQEQRRVFPAFFQADQRQQGTKAHDKHVKSPEGLRVKREKSALIADQIIVELRVTAIVLSLIHI